MSNAGPGGDQPGVGRGRGVHVAAELAVRRRHRVHQPRVEADRVQQCGPGALLVAVAESSRDESLVAPEDLDPPPVDGVPGRRGGDPASTSVPTPPPVSTTDGIRPVAWTSTSRVTRRAAVAAASSAGVAWTTTSVLLTGHLAATTMSVLRRRASSPPSSAGPSASVRLRAAAFCAAGLGPARRVLDEAEALGQHLGVDVVGVQPPQLLGQAVPQRPPGQRHVRSGWSVTLKVAVLVPGRSRATCPDRRVNTTECTPGRPSR